ncbi:hypothetical protein ILUMI_13499 [Ignelater luminosus]|uniref:Uncharacterized protein n=1 Tax=Ignelater luminosus TaxID=2038154 RepID=A0A8K0CYG5_IGNLU|nr:hypothetical protein ILUMI_13499 [Ignelater luminosus]
MDKWLIKGHNKNKQDNPKIERKRKPKEEISEASIFSVEADAAPSSSSASVSLATSELNDPQTKKVKRLNKFNDLWLNEPNFSSWLCKDSNMKDGNDLANLKDLEINVQKAELKLARALAKNYIPISFMDTLGPLCKDILPDSTIAKNTNLHRTKATAILKNVLGDTFVEDINEEFRTGKTSFH